MKVKSILKAQYILFLSLLIFTACDKNHGKKPGNAAYMEETANGKPMLSLTVGPDGGTSFVNPRLANLKSSSTTLKLGVDKEALKVFNQRNNTIYKPIEQEDVEFILPDGTVLAGDIDYEIIGGQIGTSIGVKVNTLNGEKYPSTEKYAIPVSIKSADGVKVLNNTKSVIITLNRIVVTSVAKVSGGGFAISTAKNFEDLEEWTLQMQANFSSLNRGNLTTAYFGNSPVAEFYTRIGAEQGIQVKNGRDGKDTWTHKPLKAKKWLQISYVYKDRSIAVYVNGELQKVFQTTRIVPRQESAIVVGNKPYNNDYVREVRFFSKALSETEIVENLYQPLSKDTPGLEAYMPLTKEAGMTDVLGVGNEVTVFDNTRIDWLDNVKFPAEELEILE